VTFEAGHEHLAQRRLVLDDEDPSRLRCCHAPFSVGGWWGRMPHCR
jgi:hypothetical protein